VTVLVVIVPGVIVPGVTLLGVIVPSVIVIGVIVIGVIVIGVIVIGVIVLVLAVGVIAAASLHQLAGPDPRGHVLRLFTVDRAVVELDHRVGALAAQPLEGDTLQAPHGPLDDRVLDSGLVERLLNTPARVPVDLDPHRRTAMELDRHHTTSRVDGGHSTTWRAGKLPARA
jgi:hypothetical protein